MIDHFYYTCQNSFFKRYFENLIMSDLSTLFAQAQENIKTLSNKPNDDTMLELYSLFKQGSDGDVTGDRPGFFDFVGGAKFYAREKLKGMSNDDAMQKYIEKVNSLIG
jgi:acyl-CoA-binding protein